MDIQYKKERQKYYLFSLSFILRNISLGIYLLLFNLYISDISYSDTFLGLFLAVGNITMCIGSIPSGIIIDKFNKKKLLIFFIIISSLILFLQSVVLNKPILLLISILYGFCFIAINNITGPYLIELKEMNKKNNLIILNRAMALIATPIGTLLGGYFSNVNIGIITQKYRFGLIISAIVYLISVVPILFLKDKNSIDNQKINSEEKNTKSRNTYFGRFAINKLSIYCVILFFLGIIAMLPSYTNLYLKLRFDLDIAILGLLIGFMQIAISAGVFIISKVANKTEGFKLTMTLIISMIILSYVAIKIPNIIIQVIILVLLFSSFNVLISSLYSYILESMGKNISGLVTGIVNTSYNLSESIGIYMANILIMKGEFNNIFIINIVCLIIVIIVVTYAIKKNILLKKSM